MNKPRVLFLCTSNSARSQMCEAFLRRYAGDRFEVFSAGLEPKGINPYTLQVMQEIGYDLDGHASKELHPFMGRIHFGYLITVCANAEKNCPIFPGMGRRMHWAFDDPARFEGSDEERLAKYREVRDLISDKVRAWLVEQDILIEVEPQN